MKRIWIVFCTLLGFAIGIVLSNWIGDTVISKALVGLSGGLVGWIIGRFVPIWELILEMFS